MIKERLAFAPPTATPVPYSQPYRQLTPQPYLPNPAEIHASHSDSKAAVEKPNAEGFCRSRSLPRRQNLIPGDSSRRRCRLRLVHNPSCRRRSRAPAIKQAVPKGWQRFEFNGQTFYIVPTDQVPKGDKPSIRK